jgi:hypothetical protein
VSPAILSLPSYRPCGRILVAPYDTPGRVVNEEERHRTALERLLWRRVLGRLPKVAPGASVSVGFAVGKEPAQELA